MGQALKSEKRRAKMNKEYPAMFRVIDEKSELYLEPRIESSIIKTVEIGTVIRLGKTIKKNGKQWVEIMVGNEKGLYCSGIGFCGVDEYFCK